MGLAGQTSGKIILLWYNHRGNVGMLTKHMTAAALQ